jgi:MazG family protein
MPSRPRRRRRAPESIRKKAVSPARAGRRFGELVGIMRRLRSARGCPWDREQTLHTLRPFLLEETYEALDAIDRGDHAALAGEIGDLLFEAVFLAQVSADEGRFTVADALAAITAKLIRRHPHVFGPGASARTRRRGVRTSGQVLEQWEQIKAREQAARGERRTVLGGVPAQLPALLGAFEIGSRVAAVGFDWTRPADVVTKVEEEVAELRRAVDHEAPARVEEEMGDLLFSIANLARKLGVEPESALRQANTKFTKRFTALEDRLHARGRSVHDASLEEMEAEWKAIKTNHDGRSR